MLLEYIFLTLVVSGITVSFIYCAITGISPVSSTRQSRQSTLKWMPDNKLVT